MSRRYAAADAILGEQRAKLATTRALMVGAGGIGCELLKNCVCAGFGDITIILYVANAAIRTDPLHDTIDLSNLNRQFLFQKQHVKRPKVARETASQFNPHVKIEAIHGNIKDAQYDVAFYQSFDIVLNALDNVDIPLIESGSAGYNGQAVSCCYDCSPKETPKTYPVCTIRSTPSTPIHCIVWAKSYLFPCVAFDTDSDPSRQLFGPEDDTDGAALDAAAAAGENASEIAELRKEADAIKDIRATLAQPGAARRVFAKVFSEDIERLLKMEDMWKSRKRPTPLSFDELSAAPQSSATNGASTHQLSDQRTLSLQDSFELFLSSFSRLVSRAQADATPLDWDKDDDDALDFAVASSNLRAASFSIPLKTRWEVKSMAGNIIPAIATTNAIVAGLIVLQALKVLRQRWSDAKIVYVARSAIKATSWAYLPTPNPRCGTCSTPYVALQADVSRLTLHAFVHEVCPKIGLPEEGGVAVNDGSRILFDPDFEDNAAKTLEQLGISVGSMLTVADEDGDLSSVVVLISALTDATTDESYRLPTTLPDIPTRLPPLPSEETVAAEPAVSLKRKADEAEIGHDSTDQAQASKKLKIDADGVSILIEDDAPNGVIDLDSD